MLPCTADVREENPEPLSTVVSAGLARACSSPAGPPAVPAPADSTWEARLRHSPGASAGAPSALDADAPGWAPVAAEPAGWLAPGLAGADPEPVKAPVLAASATPPVAKAASDAAM